MRKKKRAKRTKVNNQVIGYDTDNSIRADGRIRPPLQFETVAKSIVVSNPATGNHKLSKVQAAYEDVNAFIAKRKWQTPSHDTQASGTTWLELFTLFDMSGIRRKRARCRKNEVVAGRVDARQVARKDCHSVEKTRHEETVETRPKLHEELATFKRLFRHVINQDITKEDARIFAAEDKQQYKRLKGLGILGHQPAIKANCQLTASEERTITKAIFAEKRGVTDKQIKAFEENQAKEGQAENILIKRAKVDYTSCPKWKRVEKGGSFTHDSSTDGHNGNGQGDDMGLPVVRPWPYEERVIKCPACEANIETAKMQLFCHQGFRDIHCSTCRHHFRTKGIHCSCNKPWHTCDKHRTGPLVHRSQRAPAKRK